MLKVKEKVTSFWQNHNLEKFHSYIHVCTSLGANIHSHSLHIREWRYLSQYIDWCQYRMILALSLYWY